MSPASQKVAGPNNTKTAQNTWGVIKKKLFTGHGAPAGGEAPIHREGRSHHEDGLDLPEEWSISSQRC